MAQINLNEEELKACISGLGWRISEGDCEPKIKESDYTGLKIHYGARKKIETFGSSPRLKA